MFLLNRKLLKIGRAITEAYTKQRCENAKGRCSGRIARPPN